MEKCVALLQDDSDEKRFVGLLLASKLVKSTADLTILFDAGIHFIRRLLCSPAPAQSRECNPYQDLALAVLASFATESTLQSRSEYISCAIAAATAFLSTAPSTSALIDSSTVLSAALMHPMGVTEALHARLASSVLAVAATSSTPSASLDSASAPPSHEESDSASPPPPSSSRPTYSHSNETEGQTRSAGDLACELLELFCASSVSQSAVICADESSKHALETELLASTLLLANALAASRDTLTFRRLQSLLALLRSVRSVVQPVAREIAEAMERPLLEALSSLLSSRVPSATRSLALQVVVEAIAIFGSSWLIRETTSLRPPPTTPDGLPSSHSKGSFLALLIQLCSVELQLALYDQPSDVTDECERVVAACCELLEQALFKLHADSRCESDDDTTHAEEWLNALTDAQLMSSQRAFLASIKSAVDYCEALQAEEAEVSHGTKSDQEARTQLLGKRHPLLLPIARLIAAWTAQLSAPEAVDLYDRTLFVLPFLREVCEKEEGNAWIDHLLVHERMPSNAEPSLHSSKPECDETMADLFSRLLPRAEI